MVETRARRPKAAPEAPGGRILVVDDEELIRETLAEYLTQEGFSVTACASGELALREAERHPFAIAICDMQMPPGMDGLELLDRLLQISPETGVVLITAYATVENAVEAFGRGAHDYLMKPILLDEVLGKVRRLLAMRELAMENRWLRRELHRACPPAQLVGHSPAILAVHEMIRKLAPTRSTVLITGESGTGKELVARAIHDQSLAGRPDARSARFLAVNCAAIPHDLLESQLFGHCKGAFTGADSARAGVFVHAGAGTVFLDEVGEMSLATQAKILRAIEQKEVLPVGANEPVRVEARVLAATNKDLMGEVEEGRFREDLYYRLNVVSVRVPPLRERREDIPALVEHLLARHAESLGKRIRAVTHEAMTLLRGCRWRGNVRELDNALGRAVILGEGPLITPADLPPDLAPSESEPALIDNLTEALARFEKAHIERILRETPDKREAAKRLNVGLSSLYRKILDLKIQT
jgi:DNA-binding NtrC family response regulator